MAWPSRSGSLRTPLLDALSRDDFLLPPEARTYARGDKVEIWSYAEKKWIEGEIEKVFTTDCFDDAGAYTPNVRAGTLRVAYADTRKYVFSEQIGDLVRMASPENSMLANEGFQEAAPMDCKIVVDASLVASPRSDFVSDEGLSRIWDVQDSAVPKEATPGGDAVANDGNTAAYLSSSSPIAERPTASAVEALFVIGLVGNADWTAVYDTEAEAQNGCLADARCLGYGKSHEGGFFTIVASARNWVSGIPGAHVEWVKVIYRRGQLVEKRDKREYWTRGYVTGLHPLTVTDGDACPNDPGYTWDEVRVLQECNEEGIRIVTSALPLIDGLGQRIRSHQDSISTFIGYLPWSQLWTAQEASKLAADASTKARMLNTIAGRGFLLGAALDFLCLLLDRNRALTEIPGLRDALEKHGGFGSIREVPTSSFCPHTSTTQDVAFWSIIPFTARKKSALALILNGSRSCYPKCIISHTWQSVFTHTLAAAVTDAFKDQRSAECVRSDTFYCFHNVVRLTSFDRVRQLVADLAQMPHQPLLSTYWLCAMSVNQHTVVCNKELVEVKERAAIIPKICGPRSLKTLASDFCPCGVEKHTHGNDSKSEIGAFDEMMKRAQEITPDFYQLIAVDKAAVSYVALPNLNDKTKRSSPPFGFCVDEKTHQITHIIADGALNIWNLEGKPAWQPDVRVGDQVVAVNSAFAFGPSQTLGGCLYTHRNDDRVELVVRRPASVFTRVWVVAEVNEAHKAGIPQHVILYFPLSVANCGNLLNSIDVRKCEATDPADRKLILGKIAPGGENASLGKIWNERKYSKYNSRVRESLLRELGARLTFGSIVDWSVMYILWIGTFLVSACALLIIIIMLGWWVYVVFFAGSFLSTFTDYTWAMYLDGFRVCTWYLTGGKKDQDPVDSFVIDTECFCFMTLETLVPAVVFPISVTMLMVTPFCWLAAALLDLPMYHKRLQLEVHAHVAKLKFKFLLDEIKLLPRFQKAAMQKELIDATFEFLSSVHTPWWFTADGLLLILDLECNSGVAYREALQQVEPSRAVRQALPFLVTVSIVLVIPSFLCLFLVATLGRVYMVCAISVFVYFIAWVCWNAGNGWRLLAVYLALYPAMFDLVAFYDLLMFFFSMASGDAKWLEKWCAGEYALFPDISQINSTFLCRCYGSNSTVLAC